MSDLLIVKSRVQDEIRDKGCSPTQDAINEINDRVKDTIKEATKRTKANSRKRVKPSDV